MALKEKTKKIIQKSVERFIAFLKYRAVGPHALTKAQLKDLVRSGWIKNMGTTHAVAESYNLTHARVADTIMPMSSREGSIKYLEGMFNNYAEKAGLLQDPKNWGKYLGNELHGKVEGWRGRWSTIVKTELNNASNWGSIDAILHNNKHKNPEDLYVFKAGRPTSDPRICKFCVKFWFTEDGVTPRVYRMSELIAKGSNIGRKAAEWTETVGSTHPNCSHHLIEMRPGYGFDDKGNLEYKSKTHNQHTHQKFHIVK
jgi:hypothetical protein